MTATVDTAAETICAMLAGQYGPVVREVAQRAVEHHWTRNALAAPQVVLDDVTRRLVARLSELIAEHGALPADALARVEELLLALRGAA